MFEHLAYVGDVTTLCHVQLQDEAETTVLLAGVGSQLHVYHLPSGRVLLCITLLQGARIHGIQCSSIDGTDATLLVHGDRYAQVSCLRVQYTNGELRAAVQGGHTLPPFQHWTVDALLLRPAASFQQPTFAIGLSDNSFELYRTLQLGPQHGSSGTVQVALLCRAQCSVRCLLYALHLLQCEPGGAVWAAAGTVFLDVLVWQLPAARLGAAMAGVDGDGVVHTAVPLFRLVGHQGSIHRVRWGPDATRLASGSDDRTLRLWRLPPCGAAATAATDGCAGADLVPTTAGSCDGGNVAVLHAQVIVFAHTGRIWECRWGNGFVATGSEDCSCAIWDAESGGKLAGMQAHRGRGIWQCLILDRCLITAGADSSIKLWDLSEWLPRKWVPRAVSAPAWLQGPAPHGASNDELEAHVERFLLGNAPPELVCSHRRAGDCSSGEWLACLCLGGLDVLYAATNRGRCFRVRLRGGGRTHEEWVLLHQLEKPGRSIRMAVQRATTATVGGDVDTVLMGCSSGEAVRLHVTRPPANGGGAGTAPCCEHAAWMPHDGRPIMDVFLSRELGPRHAFTTSTDCTLRWWRLQSPDGGAAYAGLQLLAELQPQPSSRIFSVAVSLQQRLVVCGDEGGGVAAFAWRDGLVEGPPCGAGGAGEDDAAQSRMSLVGRVRGTHGGSAVGLLSFVGGTLFTGGRDCIINAYRYLPERARAVLCGQAGCKRNALVAAGSQRVAAVTIAEVDWRGEDEWVMGGVQGSQCIVYSMQQHYPLLRATVGSWKRLHSMHIASQHAAACACADDGAITVHRLLPPRSMPAGPGAAPTGSGAGPRTLHLVHHGREINAVVLVVAKDGRWSAMVTGSEDGTLRTVLHDSAGERSGMFRSATGLGEHLAGTAIRSMVLVPAGESWLLVTAGAKQVLMLWQLSWHAGAQGGRLLRSSQLAARPPAAGVRPKANRPGHALPSPEPRLLAVAAFTPANTPSPDNKAPPTILVTASADANVALVAVDGQSGCWTTLAALQYHSCPALSLAAVSLFPGGGRASLRCLAFTGSTDGCVAAWDVTSAMQRHPAPGGGGCGAPEVLQPLAVLPKVHQSAVNGMAAAVVDGDVLLLTAGDDQGLALVVVQGVYGDIPDVRMGVSAFVSNAHSSAVRAVWSNGRTAVTTGLDQRLRSWHVQRSRPLPEQRLQEHACMVTQVLEPAALDVHEEASGGFQVGVVGRGAQLLHLPALPRI